MVDGRLDQRVRTGAEERPDRVRRQHDRAGTAAGNRRRQRGLEHGCGERKIDRRQPSVYDRVRTDTTGNAVVPFGDVTFKAREKRSREIEITMKLCFKRTFVVRAAT